MRLVMFIKRICYVMLCYVMLCVRHSDPQHTGNDVSIRRCHWRRSLLGIVARPLFGPNGQAILLPYHFLLLLNKKNQLLALMQQDLFQLYYSHCCHQMYFMTSKCTKMCLQPGLFSRYHWGACSASQTPSSIQRGRFGSE